VVAWTASGLWYISWGHPLGVIAAGYRDAKLATQVDLATVAPTGRELSRNDLVESGSSGFAMWGSGARLTSTEQPGAAVPHQMGMINLCLDGSWRAVNLRSTADSRAGRTAVRGWRAYGPVLTTFSRTWSHSPVPVTR
jgi:hypothetical protein